MMALKLKPSAKLKRRYLLIEGNKAGVEKAILDYTGILGWAKASPFFVKMFGKKAEKVKGKNVVLAVNRKEVDNIRASFEACREKIKVLRVSGTLKGLTKSEIK